MKVFGAAFLGALALIALFAACAPARPKMPPVVNESLDDILTSLQIELEKYDPEIAKALQPGISPEELEKAEADLGRPLHPEIQALYRWHDGLAHGRELIPGHEFWSLEEAIRTNHELAAAYREHGVSALMAHEAGWLTLFPDPAGDGYYYDPTQSYPDGGVFYNFRESGYYLYFPSIRNLLAAVVECYRTGAYKYGEMLNFELELGILRKYGVEFQQ